MANDTWLSRTPVVVLLTLVCALLWGSAFPLLKTGYGLLQITESTAGQLYFAGWRFLLAGAMIFAGLKILGRPLLLPEKKDYLLLLLVGVLQTSLQYAFLYVGLAHTSSIKASIISGSGSFFLALLSHWMIAGDVLSLKKLAGLVTGFLGIAVYRFLIPVCGTFLSAAILPLEHLEWQALVALILVCCGMVLTADGGQAGFYGSLLRRWPGAGRFPHLRRTMVRGKANMQKALLPIDSKFPDRR